MSVDSDIGELFDRVRALEANPPTNLDHVVFFDRDLQEDTFLYMKLDGTVSIGDPYGLHIVGTAEPGGFLLEQGSGANYSEVHVYNTGTGDGTVHLQGMFVLVNAQTGFEVRDGGGANLTFLVDAANHHVFMKGLPTVDPATHDGQVWNNAGTLAIST